MATAIILFQLAIVLALIFIGARVGSIGPRTGELLSDATSCSMCRRQIINAGLSRVVIRKTPTEYEVVPVSQWVEEDDSLPG